MITTTVAKVIQKEVKDLLKEVTSTEDALNYVADICRDIDDEHNLGAEDDPAKELELRNAVLAAIRGTNVE